MLRNGLQPAFSPTYLVLWRNGRRRWGRTGLSGARDTTASPSCAVDLVNFNQARRISVLPSAESPCTFTPLASRKLRQASTFSICGGRWNTVSSRDGHEENAAILYIPPTQMSRGFEKDSDRHPPIKPTIVWLSPDPQSSTLGLGSVAY